MNKRLEGKVKYWKKSIEENKTIGFLCDDIKKNQVGNSETSDMEIEITNIYFKEETSTKVLMKRHTDLWKCYWTAKEERKERNCAVTIVWMSLPKVSSRQNLHCTSEFGPFNLSSFVAIKFIFDILYFFEWRGKGAFLLACKTNYFIHRSKAPVAAITTLLNLLNSKLGKCIQQRWTPSYNCLQIILEIRVRSNPSSKGTIWECKYLHFPLFSRNSRKPP